MTSFRIATITAQAVCPVGLSFGMVYVIAAQWTMAMSSEGRLIIFIMVALLWILIFWLRRRWVYWHDESQENLLEAAKNSNLLQKVMDELEQTTNDANEMMKIGVLARHEAEFWREGVKDVLQELHTEGIIESPEACIEEYGLECSAYLTDVSEAMRENIEENAESEEIDEETREAMRTSIKKLFNRRRE